MSETSLMEAKKVESLPSVDLESNQNLILAKENPMKKSLEDVSAELVKETLAKALSGEINANNDTATEASSFVESPSRMILVQPQNSSESQPEPLIDTPSTTNLAQVNDCYASVNDKNVNDQSSTDNCEVQPAEADHVLPSDNVNTFVTQISELNISESEELIDKTEDQEEAQIKENKSNISTVESKIELYSSSSTHLCSKLSEVLESTEQKSQQQISAQMISEEKMPEKNNSEQNMPGQKCESVRSIDLSKHDLRTSVSLIESMSGTLEHAVSETIGDNHKKLEEKFESQHDIKTDFNAVRDMGHTMLEDDVKTSKASSNHHYSEESMGQELTKGDISNLRMCPKINQSEAEITISKLKIEVESYRTELEKIRPDSNNVVLRCNALDIDPAIATVPHLLDLLTTARAQNIALQDEVQDLSTKLSNTTNLLDDQKHLYQELKKKLKSIDVEDDRRREKNLTEMDNYYKNKLNEIETELKERGIHIGADFWTPHLTNMREFLSQIHMHKDEVAEEELQRELSNAGTDKFSDDEPMVFPVQGYRESLCETNKTPAKYLEEDPAPEVAVPAPSGGKSKEESAKSKTCAIQ